MGCRVYVVRIKCEKHSETHSRLQSIMQSLFPKGSKLILPRDVPLGLFVKILHLLAQARRHSTPALHCTALLLDSHSVKHPLATLRVVCIV